MRNRRGRPLLLTSFMAVLNDPLSGICINDKSIDLKGAIGVAAGSHDFDNKGVTATLRHRRNA